VNSIPASVQYASTASLMNLLPLSVSKPPRSGNGSVPRSEPRRSTRLACRERHAFGPARRDIDQYERVNEATRNRLAAVDDEAASKNPGSGSFQSAEVIEGELVLTREDLQIAGTPPRTVILPGSKLTRAFRPRLFS